MLANIMAREPKPQPNLILADSVEAWGNKYGQSEDGYISGLIAALRENKNLHVWATFDPVDYLPIPMLGNGSKLAGWVRILTVLRNVLVFAPVALTWIAVGEATKGFQEYIQTNTTGVANFLTAGLTNHDCNLTFIIQPFATFRANNVAVVCVQRTDWFVEISWRCWKLGDELIDAAVIVQMHTDDLGRIAGWQMHRLVQANASSISGHEPVAVTRGKDGVTIEKYAAIFDSHGLLLTESCRPYITGSSLDWPSWPSWNREGQLHRLQFKSRSNHVRAQGPFLPAYPCRQGVDRSASSMALFRRAHYAGVPH